MINYDGFCNLCSCAFCSRFECVTGLFGPVLLSLLTGAIEEIKMTTVIHRGARAPFANERVCLEPDQTTGSEFKLNPQTDDLALMHDLIKGWGKDLKVYRK